MGPAVRKKSYRGNPGPPTRKKIISRHWPLAAHAECRDMIFWAKFKSDYYLALGRMPWLQRYGKVVRPARIGLLLVIVVGGM